MRYNPSLAMPLQCYSHRSAAEKPFPIACVWVVELMTRYFIVTYKPCHHLLRFICSWAACHSSWLALAESKYERRVHEWQACQDKWSRLNWRKDLKCQAQTSLQCVNGKQHVFNMNSLYNSHLHKMRNWWERWMYYFVQKCKGERVNRERNTADLLLL